MKITMGNDEFILYIRKKYPECSITNDNLGKKIWQWIKEHDSTAEKVKSNLPAYWGKTGSFIDALKLPKTADQFAFKRNLLPELFDFLDLIGK